MRKYDVTRTETEPPHRGTVGGTPWERATPLEVDQFNWHESGPKPRTTARLLYDSDALYLQFHVEDRNISSAVTELNGPTFQDSSVELFADPGEGSHYFNFEANCCGYFKLAWQEYGWQERSVDRDLIPATLADQVDVTTSISGPTRRPRDDDERWWLTAAIPFTTLAEFTDVDVGPEVGTEWRANVYRSGVASVSQKSTWNPMPTSEPAYHSPEYFGRLRFR